MLFSDVIELAKIVPGENAVGDPIENYSYREVFVNRKSVRSTEFYQAMSIGLKPEIVFEVRTEEYDDETKLRYNNKLYDVIRTYQKNLNFIELTCTSQIKRGEVDG